MPSRDPDDFCPICGRRQPDGGHRCSTRDLERLERSYKAAERSSGRPPRGEAERLVEGLRIMEDDPWGDDGFDRWLR